jgi:hypothetical protein
VLAVQKLQRLPTELQAEGALASLRLIAEVRVQAPERLASHGGTFNNACTVLDTGTLTVHQ